MTLIVLLFLMGVVFIAVEVIIPGGILGAIGGLLMFAGSVVASPPTALGAVFSPWRRTLLGGRALFFEFRILPKTAIGKRAFLTSGDAGVSAALRKETVDLVGHPAEALSCLSQRLRPSRTASATERSQSGKIPAGAMLDMVGTDDFGLIALFAKPTGPPHRHVTISTIVLVVVAILGLLLFGMVLSFFSVWLRAWLAEAYISFTDFVAMRLRQVPYGMVVDARSPRRRPASTFRSTTSKPTSSPEVT